MCKASREWAAPEEKRRQAHGPGGVRRAAGQPRPSGSSRSQATSPEPQFPPPVEWGGSPGGAAGSSLALVPSQLSGAEAGVRVVDGDREPTMKPVDSNMSLGVPAHATENLRQDDVPPTSHPCIVSASPAPPTLLLTTQSLHGNGLRNWEGECGCSGPSSGISQLCGPGQVP